MGILIKTLYCAHVCPILEYDMVLWTRQQISRLLIERVQRKFLRHVTFRHKIPCPHTITFSLLQNFVQPQYYSPTYNYLPTYFIIIMFIFLLVFNEISRFAKIYSYHYPLFNSIFLIQNSHILRLMIYANDVITFNTR